MGEIREAVEQDIDTVCSLLDAAYYRGELFKDKYEGLRGAAMKLADAAGLCYLESADSGTTKTMQQQHAEADLNALADIPVLLNPFKMPKETGRTSCKDPDAQNMYDKFQARYAHWSDAEVAESSLDAQTKVLLLLGRCEKLRAGVCDDHLTQDPHLTQDLKDEINRHLQEKAELRCEISKLKSQLEA